MPTTTEMHMYRHDATTHTKAKRLLASCLSVIAAALLMGSHHFETKVAMEHPELDLTDLFVFDAAEENRTVFMIDCNPQTKEKAAFHEAGVYSVHMSENESLSKGFTFTVTVKGDELTLGKTPFANPAVGTIGEPIMTAKIGESKESAEGIRIWAGAARDPFVGSAGGIVAFKERLAAGSFDSGALLGHGDFFATLNTSAIVIEVPNEILPRHIHTFASTALYLDGQWVQVNRLANVLMTHLFMFQGPLEQLEHVQHRPDTDHERQSEISSTVLRAVALAGSQQDPVKYADAIADALTPDLLPYEVGTAASYAVKRRNGRRPTDDAMDTVLSMFAGQELKDDANEFDRHPGTFPYVVQD